MQQQGFHNLFANTVNRIERGHWLLKNHRNTRTANITKLLFIQREHIDLLMFFLVGELIELAPVKQDFTPRMMTDAMR